MMKLSEIVQTEAEVVYEGEFEVLAKCLDKPLMPFLTYVEDEKYIEELNHNEMISCVIIKQEFLSKINRINIGVVISEQPKYVFFLIHNKLAHKAIEKKIEIGEGCTISHKANFNSDYIIIGNNVIIEDNVNINGNVIIEDNVIVRSGTILGSASFENCSKPNGGWLRVIEQGIIHIEENAEIGELTVIDNAIFSWDRTMIGKDTFIAARVIIGHGCKIGNNVVIKVGAIVCGFVEINNYSEICPGSIISNRICLGENSKVSIGAVVTKDVASGEKVSGNFAIRHELFLKYLTSIK